MLPELDMRAPELLLGLCYRCLVGLHDPADAPLTRRRLENLQADATARSLEISGMRADLQIARDKASAAKRELEEADVDLRLFNEQHPPPPERRGLLGSRPGREDKELAACRREIVRLHEMAEENASKTEATMARLDKQERETARELESLRGKQAEHAASLRGQYAAAVLDACASGDWKQAEAKLGDLRQALRGDLAVAVLSVLASYFQHGVAAGRQSVLELSGLFESHPPQARRVVEALLSYAAGAQMDRSELGLVLPGQLAWNGLYALYQCVAALSGWQPGTEGMEGLEQRTAEALALALPGKPVAVDEREAMQDRLLELAAGGDVVVRGLCVQRALSEGWLAFALACAGLETELDGEDKAQAQPTGPRAQVAALEFPAWPAALTEPWQALLCCQALLAGHCQLDPETCARWLAESYDWPKSDYYWWVLSVVKQDAGLLRNLGAAGGIAPVARI